MDSLGESIKDSVAILQRDGLPQNWVKMVQYNGELYPILHERINGDCLQINDSSIIIPMMEGAWPLNIVSIKKFATNKFKIHAKEATDKGKFEDRFVDIEIFNTSQGIASFFFQEPGKKGYYMIMIDADRISSRPIIVIADSLNNRVSTQFNGEPIDNQKLKIGMK